MSNVIQIKHGTGKPSNDILQPYELGYSTSEGVLYIGDANKNTQPLKYLPLSGGTITGGTSFNSTISVAGQATFNGITANANAVFNKSVSINEEIIVGAINYGTSLPSSGTVGQLFFKLI